jgi:hypothetical protein
VISLLFLFQGDEKACKGPARQQRTAWRWEIRKNECRQHNSRFASERIVQIARDIKKEKGAAIGHRNQEQRKMLSEEEFSQATQETGTTGCVETPTNSYI